jgi:tetratricopeptide (TPR) repeat protein
MEILKKITTEPTPQAISLAPDAPRALNAICAKAMHKNRSDRYQSALDLAEDVERWLADEPVSVYADPWGERLARWMRHHRAWTQTAAVSLVCVTLISTIAVFFVNAARTREAAAKRELQVAIQDTQKAKQEATVRFQETRAAVDKSLTGVADVLRYYPAVQPLRVRLLEEAAQDYERFAGERSDDLELQFETARAKVRLGEVRSWLEQWPAAEQKYRQAESFLESLLADAPSPGDCQLELVNCRVQRGFALFSLGKTEEAEAAYESALKILAAADVSAERVAEWRIVEAGALSRLAALHAHVGDLEAALVHGARAAEIFDALAADEEDPDIVARRAAVRNQQGQLLRQLGRLDEARKALDAASTDYLLLSARNEHNPAYLQGAAESLLSFANLLSSLCDESEADEAYGLAISQFKLLLKTIPDVPRYRQGLASAQREHAQLLLLRGDAPAAREAVEQALNAFIDLTLEMPEVQQYHEGHGATALTYGFILRDLDEDPYAMEAAELAIEIFEELCGFQPDGPQYRVNLAVSRSLQARVFQKQKQYAEAQKCLLAAIEDLKLAQRLEGEPLPGTKDTLALTHALLGDAYLKAGQVDEAKESYRAAFAIRDLLTDQLRHIANLTWMLLHCGDVTQRDPSRAENLAKHLADQMPTNARFQSLLGMAYYRNAEWGLSLDSLKEASRLRNDHEHSFDWFFIAMAQWQSGQKAEARQSYQKAVSIMDAKHSGNLRAVAFRAEAEDLLGISGPASDSDE